MDEFLSKIEPFRSLTPAMLRKLCKTAHEKRLAKGETVFEAGQAAEAVWVIRQGRVHLMRFLANGKVSTTCVQTNGEVFCCVSTLDRKAYPADAIAAEESVVVCIPMDAFHDAFKRSPEFQEKVLCLFCDRVRAIEEKGCMVYESADERIAQTLLTLSRKFGKTIPLTREELAELTGTTHETVIRVLSRFKKAKWISSSRGQTTLENPQALTGLLNPS